MHSNATGNKKTIKNIYNTMYTREPQTGPKSTINASTLLNKSDLGNTTNTKTADINNAALIPTFLDLTNFFIRSIINYSSTGSSPCKYNK